MHRPIIAVIVLGFIVAAWEGPAPVMAADSPALAARLRPLIAAHRGQVALAVRHLETGESFTHHATTPMPTASLIKFPVMVTAYRQVDAGLLDLDRLLTLRAEDKVQGSGILTTHFSPGMQLSLRDAIRLMIAYSDNTATNLVVGQIGLAATAETMEQLGFPQTKLHALVFRGDTSIFPERSKQFGLGSTTAADMVALLAQLHERKLASPESCQAMLEHLLACEDRDRLPRELPRGTKVAHKTGSVNAVRTDAGILFLPGGPVAVCVLTAENEDQQWTRENAGEVLCGRIGKELYDHFRGPGGKEVVSPDGPTTLALGASGTLVESLQRTLNARLTPSPELGVDGDFGPVTQEAVKRFQQAQQLAVTGEVDSATWKALSPLLVEPEPVPAPEVVNGESLPREPELPATAPPFVTCKAWAIADASTGVVLWGNLAHQPLNFASTTKIMTAYVVLRLAAEDPGVLDEVITISERADQTIGSTADVRAGEQVPVRELLYGLLLPSGNDAATAFAEHFGRRWVASPGADPAEAFVAEMNRAAESLGMADTHYTNPHGLTAGGHLSTAADLVKLTHAARQLPHFREYINTRQRGCTVQSSAGYSRNVLWKNTNKLLAFEEYCGVKTGTTDAAGACLVSAGERDGDALLVVVLGSATSDARYVDTRNLFRWAWSQR